MQRLHLIENSLLNRVQIVRSTWNFTRSHLQSRTKLFIDRLRFAILAQHTQLTTTPTQTAVVVVVCELLALDKCKVTVPFFAYALQCNKGTTFPLIRYHPRTCERTAINSYYARIFYLPA